MAAWETLLGDTAKTARQELIALCDCLENYEQLTDFEINLGITRGFDFYTGAVFQIEASEKSLPLCRWREIRWTHRVLWRSTNTGGAGFAFQFEALVEAFAATGKATGNGRRDYFIAAETSEQTSEAQRLAETLRKEGKNVEVDLMERDFPSTTGLRQPTELRLSAPFSDRRFDVPDSSSELATHKKSLLPISFRRCCSSKIGKECNYLLEKGAQVKKCKRNHNRR